MDKRQGANADISQKLDQYILRKKMRSNFCPAFSSATPIQISFCQKQAGN